MVEGGLDDGGEGYRGEAGERGMRCRGIVGGKFGGDERLRGREDRRG